MLLTADADRAYFGFPRFDLLQAFHDGRLGSVNPVLRLLFHVPGRQTRNQVIGLLGSRKNFSGFQIQDDRFGALSSTIDAEIKHRDSKYCNRSIVRATSPS